MRNRPTTVPLTSTLLTCALLVGGWAAAPRAWACSCAGASTDEQFGRADAVFTGTLLSREVLAPAGSGRSSGDPALHVFAVDTLHKGVADPRQQVVSADSGASCGLELAGDGPFLVFATDPPDLPEGQLAADLRGGTAPLTPELAAEVRDLAPGTEGLPLTGAPGPADPQAAAAGPSSGAGTAVGLAVLAAGALGVLGWRRTRRRGPAVSGSSPAG
ncbi:hypothetical protein [Modestobacter sp. SYSU DS0875]